MASNPTDSIQSEEMICRRFQIRRLPGHIHSFLTAEWILTWRFTRKPNGGGVILVRSLLISVEIYLVAIAIRSRVSPAATWTWGGWDALAPEVRETLHWLGALFGGTYAVLYSRFSAQWAYLAGLYNLIKEKEVDAAMLGTKSSKETTASLSDLKASFLEDAEELHLVRKPIFAWIALAWTRDAQVREMFRRGAAGGLGRFDLLAQEVARSCSRHGTDVDLDVLLRNRRREKKKRR